MNLAPRDVNARTTGDVTLLLEYVNAPLVGLARFALTSTYDFLLAYIQLYNTYLLMSETKLMFQ